MHWDPCTKFKPGHFDIIWFSPPCTEYSRAKTTGIRHLDSADAIVQAGLRIINKLKPEAWFMENPVGLLRHRAFMQPYSRYRHTTTYCAYGTPYRKETDIWTIWSNVPLALHHCDQPQHCCRCITHFGRHLRTAQQGPSTSSTGVVTPGITAEEANNVPTALLDYLIDAAMPYIKHYSR